MLPKRDKRWQGTETEKGSQKRHCVGKQRSGADRGFQHRDGNCKKEEIKDSKLKKKYT